MGASAALYNPHGRFRPDAGHAQKVGILSRVDLHRKQLHMAQCPVAFRVELCMEVRVGFIEQFIRLKTVAASLPDKGGVPEEAAAWFHVRAGRNPR